MIRYDCMTPAELTLWQEAAIYDGKVIAKAPCVDCPMWYHLQEQRAGRCDRSPNATGGKPISDFSVKAARRRMVRREANKDASRRYRRRQRTAEWKAQLRAEVLAIRASQAPRIGAQS